jgi:hypothetical protein
MIITVKKFSRGSSATRFVYGTLQDGKLTILGEVKNMPGFPAFGTVETSGKYGYSSYTQEYELDLTGQAFTFAVQKWHDLNTVASYQSWEIIYQPGEETK